MKVEMKIYSIILIFAFSILTQSVCRSQDIASDISTEADTTNHLVQNGSIKKSNDADFKSSKDYSANDYISSIAFKNPVLYEGG